jgi:hypothetical protein
LSKYILKNTSFEKKENQEKAENLINTYDLVSSTYTSEVHEQVLNISKDAAFIEAFKNRENFHIFDGAEYFFSKLDTLAPPEYKPTYQDSLFSRRKTTGINQVNFKNNQTSYKRKTKIKSSY